MLDATSVQTIRMHTATMCDIRSTCEIVQVVLLTFLIPEFEEIGKSARPDSNSPNAACIHDIFNASVDHALNDTKNEDAHCLSEIKE